MYGQHHNRPRGGPRGMQPQPPLQPPPQQFPHHFPTNPNSYIQQNPNFYTHNNPTFSIPQNPYIQNPAFSIPQNPNFSIQQRPKIFPTSSKPNVTLDRIEKAIVKAHNNLLSTGETVSAWSVSQSALLLLQVDSWSSLGFQMQQVPSLYRLLVIEGKVNAFIHCFVGARRITSLYDLDVAICDNEGVERFEELKLGPLVRHPLVVHYFSLPSDTKEVHRITSEEIISCLVDFIDCCKGKSIQAEQFLQFLATKESVEVKEKLGVRIQSLKLHITSIQDARKAEESTLKNHVRSLEQKSSKQSRKEQEENLKPSSIFSQKKVLDKRFSTIARRIKSFSPINADLGGKHIRFLSSSSEDETEDDEADNEVEGQDDKVPGSHSKISSQDRQSSDRRVTSCPYPSAAEEMTRLGLKVEMDESSPASGAPICDASQKSSGKRSSGKKRKTRYWNESTKTPCLSQSSRSPKRYKAESNVVVGNLLQQNDYKQSHDFKVHSGDNSSADETADLALTDDMMDTFVTTWKDTCRVHSVTEVLERMIDFYIEPGRVRKKLKAMFSLGRRKKKIKSIFSLYPCIGLLNIAIKSIKCGMWDNLYDAFQTIGQHGCSTPSSAPETNFETIDVGLSSRRDAIPVNDRCSQLKHNVGLSSRRDAIPVNDRCSQLKHSVTVDDILKKVAAYFEIDNGATEGKSTLEIRLIFLRRLHNCERWLSEQFSVKDFSFLGYGEFFNFLEENSCELPNVFYGSFSGDVDKKTLLEVSMLGQQMVTLLSQAASSLWGNDVITKQHISSLLKKQFPAISFQVGGNDPLEDLSEILKKEEHGNFSSCVLFSVTLLPSWYEKDPVVQTHHHLAEATDLGQKSGVLGFVSAKDAIDCLLRAPMLTDLLSWSHWDFLFAPSLGPLVEWLLNEVHTKELLCLVTKDGKIIRIDHSVSVDQFLEAALQGSSFQTAVKLLSLLSLYGGDNHVPLSLLKCHARKAIDVIIKNSLDAVVVRNDWDIKMHGEASTGRQICTEETVALNSLGSIPLVENQGLSKHLFGINRAVPVASRFILDCFSYLPSEFCSFAADIFLSALSSVTKDAPAAILRECTQTSQRMMLHDIGLTLGIMEWIGDYHAFSSSVANDLHVSLVNTNVEVSNSGFVMDAIDAPETSNQLDIKSSGKHGELNTEIYVEKDLNEVSNKDDSIRVSSPHDGDKDANLVVESIRCEEFGLVPSLTHAETSMLKKQHARLGRALHCLSQELYSQDSHFLLELVQNADDNVYPESVEPTVVFILQATGVVILNNEQGFSAQNIRALCDVGNSTKRGSSAGYIGQKGIGFKSVFRVTDAPEIHSNGFHVKFDISEGQIGFVLPTVISPCDIDLYRRLVPRDEVDGTDNSWWKTCIVLPFKSKLKEGTDMSSIISKFSDLHPSLLLFLHRLRCIKFKNMLTNDCIVMRRETLGNGIVKVSHGIEKISWFVASQKLQASVIRPDVQTTEIAVAFTLEELANGEYKPHIEQQPVFAFLPLRTYGLKFILQGDFALPSSREEVDGDSAWNQWLLSEFPGLFVSALRSLCALPCFQERPGKAVVTYMSFVPLVGEVHGFFSHLPRMIISKLRISKCMLVEGQDKEWVHPCKVLRGWDEQARSLFPESLLNQHLGLGYLDKDIVLSDHLAKALGVQDYGPKVLVDIISSICQADNGMTSMGLDWLSSCLSSLYTMVVHSSGSTTLIAGVESDLNRLRQIPFIPLSDGTYSSVAEGPIWLPSGAFDSGLEGLHGPDVFPSLYGKLRTVSPCLLSSTAAKTNNTEKQTLVENCIRMLNIIGVQQLSAHDITMAHILPAVSDDKIANRDKNLMTEYLSFVMLHLQSSCTRCCIERECIISELRNKAFVLTNHGYKRPVEVSIHFSKEFGNPVDVNKLIDAMESKWHEVDTIYLKHARIKPLLFGLLKWREFFLELGVTDFVQIIQVEKNVADVPQTVLMNLMSDVDFISPGSVLKDWESIELVSLLSTLSSLKNPGKCEYLLEVLDEMWDEFFSSKITGCVISKSIEGSKLFKSSFIKTIHDVQWIVSSMDQELHFPKDLFHDCEAVRSILGASAPYAVPQVRSRKFVSDMGFKTQVTIDDALKTLRIWRKCETPFKTSIEQMSKFYHFIWDAVDTSKSNIYAEFTSGPSIFVPFGNVSRHDGLVHGMFLSQDNVYWHDPTGSVGLLKELLLQCGSINETNCHLSNTLSQVYHSLHDFFVNECRVCEIPPFKSYVKILLQLSKVALPSEAANAVIQVMLKWADDLKSGLMGPEDIIYLREFILKLENTVFPTVLGKWVSLNSTFGIVCWCDDEELRKQFKHADNISILSFGDLSDDAKEMLPAKISRLMQEIRFPSLSEVITREPISYGVEDSKDKASLVAWVLPFAQRYIYKSHPDKYFQLKQFGLETMSHLKIVVVEKLFYRYTIKGGSSASNTRSECSCLLKDNILYVTRDSDSYSLFLELSRLFYHGTPELNLANFLDVITNKAESGSTEEQIEVFIINCQKIPKLPDDEPIWGLPSSSSLEDFEISQPPYSSTLLDEQNQSRSKRKAGMNTNWPPADWKTAPDFNFSRANRYRTNPGALQPPNESSQMEDKAEFMVSCTEDHQIPIGVGVDWNIKDETVATMAASLQDMRSAEGQSRSGSVIARSSSSSEVLNQSVTVNIPEKPDFVPLAFNERDRLCFGAPNEHQAVITGRLGEFVAFKYFTEKVGKGSVNWVNEAKETGFPYDIVIGEGEESKEYIEVKATKSARKDWFAITSREWQFAVEKGESFSVAHVVLMDTKNAKVTVFKNPARLCQQGMLQLAVLMSKNPKT